LEIGFDGTGRTYQVFWSPSSLQAILDTEAGLKIVRINNSSLLEVLLSYLNRSHQAGKSTYQLQDGSVVKQVFEQLPQVTQDQLVRDGVVLLPRDYEGQAGPTSGGASGSAEDEKMG
jgi:hypothetical protein